jgi:hypothetical protein
LYPTELILDHGNVHIVDKQENVWPLRRVTAKNLAWLIEGIFSVQRLTYSEDLSKDFDLLRSICVNFLIKMEFSCATTCSMPTLNIIAHNSPHGTLKS